MLMEQSDLKLHTQDRPIQVLRALSSAPPGIVALRVPSGPEVWGEVSEPVVFLGPVLEVAAT